jgi:hypothetical protein
VAPHDRLVVTYDERRGLQEPGSTAGVYHFPDLDPTRTVAAFAATEDQGVVERAVLVAAGNGA